MATAFRMIDKQVTGRMRNKNKARRVMELAAQFKQNNIGRLSDTGKLLFSGVSNHDVYNITAPFHSAGRTVLAGRVEARDSEDSTAIFFEKAGPSWRPIPGAPQFRLQDPFVTHIDGELIFGGVEVNDVNGSLQWQTVFYRGEDIFDLTEFFRGPVGMKDIRLCALPDGHIGVFTRPNGRVGGRGTIGYVQIESLEELTIEKIESAKLLSNMFDPLDWGGVNECHVLPSGEIGLLAHVACFEQDNIEAERHYYAASFVFNTATQQFKDLKVIASRDQFKQGPAKRADLADVIFSSGLVRDGKDTMLYAGVSDAEAHWITMNDPFE